MGHTRARFGQVTRWLLSGVIVVAVAAAGVFVWNRPEQAEAIHYVTQPITRGDLRIAVTATGNLAPTNQVQVGSELSGIVKNVNVDTRTATRRLRGAIAWHETCDSRYVLNECGHGSSKERS